MAAVASSAGAADEFKKLQGQIDQLSERLDFISPMLPLVNFVQDWIQKVECEASVQLLRLRNAQVLRPKQSGEEEDISDGQLETVKYFHVVAEALAATKGGATQRSGGGLSGLSGVSMGGQGYFSSYGGSHDASPTALSSSPTGMQASFSSPGVAGGASAAYSVPAAGTCGRNYSPSMPERLLGGRGVQPQSLAFPSPPLGDQPPPVDRRQESKTGEGGGLLLGGGLSHNLSAARLSTSASPSLSPLPRAKVPAALPSGAETCLLVEPLAEPGTGGTNGTGSVLGQNRGTSDLDGLVLGRGSWAAAFRQATGPRREAFLLLCRSSIVTARELSDDLTVISQEHIDECVHIAQEMLQTWTLDMWVQQPDEAKKFFEARLTALYQRKFGEQKS